MIPDLINGLFELLGALLVLGNVLRLRRERLVRGVWWPSVAFFTAWGWWNVFFFPQMHLWFSLCGGLVMVSMNTWWVTLLIRYRRN